MKFLNSKKVEIGIIKYSFERNEMKLANFRTKKYFFEFSKFENEKYPYKLNVRIFFPNVFIQMVVTPLSSL